MSALLPPPSFALGAAVLEELIAAQGALLRELGRALRILGKEPPAIDVEAMRERLVVLAHFARLLRALEPDEADVRQTAERRAEWIRLVERAVEERQPQPAPTSVCFPPVTHEAEPASEFAAIAVAIREAAQNERNRLPGLVAIGDQHPSAGVDALVRHMHRRLALLDRGAGYFDELTPKERETRALMPGAPSPASIDKESR